MIRDARALRDEFVPAELQHREGPINHMTTCLRPITEGRPGENVLITGASGAGKTTTSKFVASELERETLGVRTGCVNCISNSTTAGVLHALLRDAGIGLDLNRDTTALDQYHGRVESVDDQFVFIIDEVDVLDDPSLLAGLYERPNVTLLMVCVDEDKLLSELDVRIESRIRSAVSIELEKYRTDELADIVAGRVEAGLHPGAADRETLERIADLAAGDARLAITLLRRAAERAEIRSLDTLNPDLVEDVADSASIEVHERNKERLSTHQRLLYSIISESGEIAASDLHDEYEHKAQSPKSRPTRRRYLASLEQYDLIEQLGATRGSRYRVTEP
ncbi:Cdc6/Cdc18 family protein [Halogeometricum limi]|uniref:Cdc6-related protein, AAA superfamily ATPase n=1 Tax=Halogeometricum limi TaxID=555875 RepID=A0A1I6FVZ5_9EURY|nr:Cdc6/Cdc18 family protein [Halogeometricum limi]SFR34094.1 Cdc6-related protein, AAA superfamily ATPase [Halogeometricum limi]